ncbi:MAG: hypothetical protein AAGH67_13500 [Cyanobacteria bacterium P01_H01_bin.162]
MTPLYAALIGQLQQDLSELDRLVKETQKVLKKFQATEDEDYLGTVALNLHSYYTGVERLLEDITRSFDEPLPEGADWHRRLLRQMSAELPDVRPAVLSVATRQQLDEYRGFRHVIRNIYSFELRSDRIQALASQLGPMHHKLRHDLDQFCEVLRALS